MAAVTDPGGFQEAVEDLLLGGYSVQFSAPGHSMHPTLKQGDTLIIDPVQPADLTIGDIVLYRRDDRLFAHRLVKIEAAPACATSRAPSESAFAPGGAGRRLSTHHGQDASTSQRSDNPPGGEALRFFLHGDYRPAPDPPIIAAQILGKVVAAERSGLRLDPCGWKARLYSRIYRLALRIKRSLPFSE